MKVENYLKKYGKIYGVSYKYEFGRRKCYCVEFDNLSDAEKWLHTEEGDFRTRELLTKSAVIGFFGEPIYTNRLKQKEETV